MAARLVTPLHVWVQFSGNVLVYSAVSPCDGDWYGGITPSNVEPFLDALADADVGASGGVSETGLRQYWRGRIGLSKEEQLQVGPACVFLHVSLSISISGTSSAYGHPLAVTPLLLC